MKTWLRILRNWLKTRLICSWKHDQHKCYPEVWGRGLEGPWHCAECHPCGEEFDHLDDLENYARGCFVGKFLPLPTTEKVD